MSESTDPQAWVLRAEEDYLLCRSALRRKIPLLSGATFHAQQCAALHDLCIQADLRIGVELD